MESFNEDDDSQVLVFRQADIKLHLAWRDDGVTLWHQTREMLKEKGAFATGQLTLSSIARSCLQLGQISAIVDSDVPTAMEHFSYPAVLKQPSFREIAGLVAAGIEGRMPWDGQRLSMAGELERLLCFLLAGKFDDIAIDYAACDDPALFNISEQDFARSYLAWQILYCATEQYDKVSFTNFDKRKCQFKKTEFGFGYELLVDAVARGDSEAFSRELELRESAFAHRQRSKRSDRMWGYGHAGRDSFDVFGSAICRLAYLRGVSFTTPSERFYPRTFWKD